MSGYDYDVENEMQQAKASKAQREIEEILATATTPDELAVAARVREFVVPQLQKVNPTKLRYGSKLRFQCQPN